MFHRWWRVSHRLHGDIDLLRVGKFGHEHMTVVNLDGLVEDPACVNTMGCHVRTRYAVSAAVRMLCRRALSSGTCGSL